MTDMKTILSFESVSKRFDTKTGTVEVVGNVNLSIQEHEFVVLLGPGQCGKTTLLNIAAGLDFPSSGRVLIRGEAVTKPGPDRGVVYQKTALFPWLTVMGNVDFGLRMAGVPKKARAEKAQALIDLVGLTGFEHQFPSKLSGGMKQRVGIARAYCIDPVILLMDEPFGHLDAQTRYMMEEELERIWERDRRTVLFVTNNIEEALYLADRIVLFGACPTQVKNEFAITLPRPRSLVSPEFLDLRKRITAEMEIE